jgi:hypothetical protein
VTIAALRAAIDRVQAARKPEPTVSAG